MRPLIRCAENSLMCYKVHNPLGSVFIVIFPPLAGTPHLRAEIIPAEG
jgi:hypothetical protein